MEDGNPIPTSQYHLRRAGALLSQQLFDAAMAEIEAALSIDPASLPAQALRERVRTAREQAARASSPPARFVPSGVDEQSWAGFEQRIQGRRFRALLESVRVAVALNDGVAARLAFEEARELRPDAPELVEVAELVALLPAANADVTAARFAWVRAAGAVGMLVVGVTLVVGLEWIRPDRSNVTAETQPATLAAPLDVAPASGAVPGDATTADIALGGESPAVAPAASVGTSGPADVIEPEVDPAEPEIMVRPEPMPAPGVRRISTYSAPAVAAPRRTFREAAAAAEAGLRPGGEVPDDYVAPQPRRDERPNGGPSLAVTAAPVSAAAPVANVSRQPAALTPLVPPVPAVVTAAVTLVPARQDDTRGVTQALNQYARAYGQLDASAAHAVWPSVDERALARAFAGLQSQTVSFDDCDIEVRGATANASCRGRASYVGKVGNREVRVEPRTWRFDLKRDGEAWKIEGAQARRVVN